MDNKDNLNEENLEKLIKTAGMELVEESLSPKASSQHKLQRDMELQDLNSSEREYFLQPRAAIGVNSSQDDANKETSRSAEIQEGDENYFLQKDNSKYHHSHPHHAKQLPSSSEQSELPESLSASGDLSSACKGSLLSILRKLHTTLLKTTQIQNTSRKFNKLSAKLREHQNALKELRRKTIEIINQHRIEYHERFSEEMDRDINELQSWVDKIEDLLQKIAPLSISEAPPQEHQLILDALEQKYSIEVSKIDV